MAEEEYCPWVEEEEAGRYQRKVVVVVEVVLLKRLAAVEAVGVRRSQAWVVAVVEASYKSW